MNWRKNYCKCKIMISRANTEANSQPDPFNQCNCQPQNKYSDIERTNLLFFYQVFKTQHETQKPYTQRFYFYNKKSTNFKISIEFWQEISFLVISIFWAHLTALPYTARTRIRHDLHKIMKKYDFKIAMWTRICMHFKRLLQQTVTVYKLMPTQETQWTQRKIDQNTWIMVAGTSKYESNTFGTVEISNLSDEEIYSYRLSIRRKLTQFCATGAWSPRKWSIPIQTSFSHTCVKFTFSSSSNVQKDTIY